MKIPFLKTQNKLLIHESIKKIEIIRKNSDLLAICATPTEYAWLGVNIATKSLFPDNTFQIPQYYSNSILSDSELKIISSKIIELEFQQVIFSGFAPYYKDLVNQLNTSIKIKVIYHGFLSELSENIKQQISFNQVIVLAKEHKIHSIGFVKKGFALSVNKMYNIPTFEIILPNNLIASTPNTLLSEQNINIGCLVNTSFRKNIHNQAMAGLMIENSKIHVFKTDELNYLPQERIINHTLIQHEKFVELLGSMAVNLHITFSESWGQVLSESISQGVPCISAYTSSFFDYDEELKQKLVVDGFDDSWFIYKKIESVLAERDSISKMCIEYAKKLNILSLERKQVFINA